MSKQEAIDALRALLPSGSTLFAAIEYERRTTRAAVPLVFYTIAGDDLKYVGGLIALALDLPRRERGEIHDGIRDDPYRIAEDLGRLLHGDRRAIAFKYLG